LDWIGLDCIGLHWIALDCIGLHWIALEPTFDHPSIPYTHRIRVVAIEPSIDCSQLSQVHEERDRVDDDSRHAAVSRNAIMASERADVRDLSSSL